MAHTQLQLVPVVMVALLQHIHKEQAVMEQILVLYPILLLAVEEVAVTVPLHKVK